MDSVTIEFIVFILVYNTILSTRQISLNLSVSNQYLLSHKYTLLFVISLLDTQYIRFYFLVVRPVYGLLVDLSA